MRENNSLKNLDNLKYDIKNVIYEKSYNFPIINLNNIVISLYTYPSTTKSFDLEVFDIGDKNTYDVNRSIKKVKITHVDYENRAGLTQKWVNIDSSQSPGLLENVSENGLPWKNFSYDPNNPTKFTLYFIPDGLPAGNYRCVLTLKAKDFHLDEGENSTDEIENSPIAIEVNFDVWDPLPPSSLLSNWGNYNVRFNRHYLKNCLKRIIFVKEEFKSLLKYYLLRI